ncbi:GNAT family N-acetyltransferase [Methanoculleus sp. Wushi-C6]|uniref:GNAT family N-acetyltransferase n=1 Tax=Methanoculleus caldifontis TaxID=2651577 RepID=A0ABU3X598_9EURY|nr:GNAT family N-acetyltransferase [Methanoculleus sp. Wushi-C6]MDV2482792.1 GNAT family N-acetyltransferase [Methanoculleus sp. Wushi-C6]
MERPPGDATHPDHPCSPVYLPFKTADVEEAARLYTDVFIADEPTTHRHAPDPEIFLPYARRYAEFLAGKELSHIARDSRTGEIAGFIFCLDLTGDLAAEGATMAEFLAQFRETVEMIDELEEQYIERDRIAAGTVLHVFQIGVARPYRGRGLAQAMIRHALLSARRRGFSRAVADCTGPASRRAFERCGFVQAGHLPYDSFSRNGVAFFLGIDGGISLMVGEIETA